MLVKEKEGENEKYFKNECREKKLAHIDPVKKYQMCKVKKNWIVKCSVVGALLITSTISVVVPNSLLAMEADVVAYAAETFGSITYNDGSGAKTLDVPNGAEVKIDATASGKFTFKFGSTKNVKELTIKNISLKGVTTLLNNQLQTLTLADIKASGTVDILSGNNLAAINVTGSTFDGLFTVYGNKNLTSLTIDKSTFKRIIIRIQISL